MRFFGSDWAIARRCGGRLRVEPRLTVGTIAKIIPQEGNVMRVDVSGRLTQSDYDQLIPSWEAFITRHGRIRLLFVMHDFHGWDPQAAWDDFRFGIKHQRSVERIAMVGEKKWQQWMTKIASWFVRADVRYFDASQEDQAGRWIREK